MCLDSSFGEVLIEMYDLFLRCLLLNSVSFSCAWQFATAIFCSNLSGDVTEDR